MSGDIEGDVAGGSIHPCCKDDGGRDWMEVGASIEECGRGKRSEVSERVDGFIQSGGHSDGRGGFGKYVVR